MAATCAAAFGLPKLIIGEFKRQLNLANNKVWAKEGKTIPPTPGPVTYYCVIIIDNVHGLFSVGIYV